MNEATTTAPLPNGELPPAREAIIEQAHRVHQEVAHERDMLRKDLSEARTEIAGYKAMLDVAELNVTQLESRVTTANLQRDQAVADRAAYEALFIIQLSNLRAFKVPNAPLVRDRSEEATDGYEDNLSREDSAPVERHPGWAG